MITRRDDDLGGVGVHARRVGVKAVGGAIHPAFKGQGLGHDGAQQDLDVHFVIAAVDTGRVVDCVGVNEPAA